MNRRTFIGQAFGAVGAFFVGTAKASVPHPSEPQNNDHIKDFTDYRELLLSIAEHTRATGDKVLPSDDPAAFPPRMGYVMVPKDTRRPMRWYRIGLGDLRRSLDAWHDKDPRIVRMFRDAQKTREGRAKIAASFPNQRA